MPTSCLKWFKRSDGSDHGSVSMLAFCAPDSEPIEMGQVSRLSTGEYWWFTTNPKIVNRHTASFPVLKLKQAEQGLEHYVGSEIDRLKNLKLPVVYHDLPDTTARRSDKKVMAIGSYDQDSFLAGMDWMLRTMGFPRKPSWAKFLVQHRDRTFTWFEKQPVHDPCTGRWDTVEESLYLNVCLDRPNDLTWTSEAAIKRIA